MTLFAYPFILIVVSHAALSLGKQRIKQMLVLLVILFVVFNLFRLPFIPVNPLESSERANIYPTEGGRVAWVRNWFPQGEPATKGGQFFQEAEQEIGVARYVRSFMVGNEMIWAEPLELEDGKTRFYEARPYAKVYRVVSPDTYLYQNKIYNNGVVEVYK